MITIFTAINKTDLTTHFFNSCKAIDLAHTYDSSAWKPTGSFKLQEGTVVAGLRIKDKQWVENRYAITN